jgi:hypothetical protein
MEKGRKIAWATTAASLVVLVGSAWLMAERMAAFHRENPRQTFAFQPLDTRDFFFGNPKKPITIADDKSDPEHPKVIITYGQDRLELPVSIPSKYELPGLKSHEDWFRVLRFSPHTGLSPEQFQSQLDAGGDRLAIATRTPVQGVDPNTWGAVWKNNWVFDFYEFNPAGGFEHERLNYPTATGTAKPKEGELHENTWEFQAALLLMPQGGTDIGPTHNFYGDALKAASWTLPLAAFSGLVCVVSLAFAAAPRRRPESSAT